MLTKRTTVVPFFTLGAVVIGLLLVSVASLDSPGQRALAGLVENEEEDRTALKKEAETLEQKIEAIEREIEKAEENDDDRRVDELHEKAEPLFERLEDIERELGEGDDDEEDEEREEHEREIRWRELELSLERAELETSFGRLEMVGRIGEIARSSEAAASYAVLHLHEYIEEDDAAKTLVGMMDTVESSTVRRVIRMQLAELYREMDRPEDAAAQLKALVAGK